MRVLLTMIFTVLAFSSLHAQQFDEKQAKKTEISFQLENLEGMWFWKFKDEDHIKISFEESGKHYAGFPLLEVKFYSRLEKKARYRFSFLSQKNQWCKGSIQSDCGYNFKMFEDGEDGYIYLVFDWAGEEMDDYAYRKLDP